MDEQVRIDINQFFENTRIQKALSDLGIFGIDYRSKRSFASDLWLRCGYSASEMNDALFPSLVHPGERDFVIDGLASLLGGQRDQFDGVFRMRRKDNSWIWIAARWAVIYRNDRGDPLLYLGHDQDVTLIKESEEEKHAQLKEIETLRQVIADVNTSLDLDETVSLILDHTRRVIPYDRCTVQFLSDRELSVIGCIGFADRESILAVRFPFPDGNNPASEAIRSRSPLVCNDVETGFPGFRQVAGAEPTRSWMGIPLIANNEVIGLLALDSIHRGFYTKRHVELAEVFAGHVALAVEKARLYGDARNQALTDQLTGAGNRHSLQLQGPFFLEKAKRERVPILALMVDLDHFKAVNDRFGHDVGDGCLKRTADAIRSCLRSYDLFFRYGGEEFLVLLPDTSEAAAREIAERIRQTVAHGPSSVGAPAPTVSLGLGSLVPGASTALSDLIRVADQALYEAKAGGRNRTAYRQGVW